jgi:lipid-A-disaccharide synthase
MKIFLGCCERSGENLLRIYLNHLIKILPNAQFYCQAFSGLKKDFPNVEVLFDSELANIMGFIEPIKRLPQLILRREAIKKWIDQHKPALFIGFDAPDFLLSIEAYARKQGAYTIHVVSPSVWAWRKNRIKKIVTSMDELHCLYAFEEKYYAHTPLKTKFIGHPLLAQKAPQLRHWPIKKLLLAPGSRDHEIKNHLPFMLKIAQQLKDESVIQEIVVAAAKGKESIIKQYVASSEIQVETLNEALSCAQFALVCSGTASLEIVADGCPALILYQVPAWKLWCLKHMIHTPYIGLPNILTQQPLVKEFVGPLHTMYNSILTSLKLLSEHNEYQQHARNIQSVMSQLLKENDRPCLQTYLTQIVSQVSMKQAEAV